MNKIAELQRALQGARPAAVAVAAAPATEPTPPKPKAASKPEPRVITEHARRVYAAREGRVHVGGYFDPQVRKSLRMIQVQTDLSLEAQILRALNDWFAAHNVPQVEPGS